MPFFQRDPEALLSMEAQIPPPGEVHAPRPEFWKDVVPAAFRLENTVAGLFLNNRDPTTPDPDFDPFAMIAGSKYEPYARSFVLADTPERVGEIQQQIDAELEAMEVLAAAGASGVAAVFVAGMLDPLIFLPVGGSVRKARLLRQVGGLARPLRGGLATAKAGAIGSAASEAVLHAQQETRTLEESAWNVTAATFLSGVLGGTLSALDDKVWKAALDDVDRQFTGVGGGSDAGPIRLTPDEMASDSAGLTNHAEIRFKKAFGVDKIISAMRINPLVRAMVTSRSNKLKEALLDLTNPPAFVEGATPRMSVEQLAQGMDVAASLLERRFDDAFVLYRDRLAGKAIPDEVDFVPFARARAAAETVRDTFGGKQYGRLNRKEFAHEVSLAVQGGGDHPIPEVGRMARAYIDEIFDPAMERMIELDLLPAEIREQGPLGARKYLMRVYDREVLIAYPEQFFGRVKPWLESQLTPDEMSAIEKAAKASGRSVAQETQRHLDLAARDIHDNLTGNSIQHLAYEPVQMGGTHALKARALGVSDETLRAPVYQPDGTSAYFLENDIRTIARIYTRTVGPDIGLRERFGSVEMRDQIEAVREEYRPIIEQADPKQRGKLDRQMKKEIEVLEAIRDRVRGVYARPPDSWWVTPLRLARISNMLSQGGGFVVSSLADVGNIVLRSGVMRTMGTAISPFVDGLNSIRLASREARLLDGALELTMNTRFMSMSDVGDAMARNRPERIANSIASNFSLVNLLGPWNHFWKRVSGIITNTRLLDLADDIAAGRKLKVKDKLDLEQAGLTREMMLRFHEQASRPGGSVKRNLLRWPNTTAWDDIEARDTYAAAMRFIVDQHIITPGAADRPLFMSTEFGKTIGQYKSFAMASTTRNLMTMAQRFRAGDMSAFNGLAMMVGIGMMVEWIKNENAGRGEKNREMTPAQWGAAGIDRSGAVGIFGDIYNVADRVGLNPLGSGGPLSSRYAARNLSSSLAGPTVGLVENLTRVLLDTSKGEWNQSTTRTFRRLIWYQNLFYWRTLLDKVEENANREFGVPKR